MAIKEQTLELAIIELNRCLKALKKLRDLRENTKALRKRLKDVDDERAQIIESGEAISVLNIVERSQLTLSILYDTSAVKEHAAALRASSLPIPG